MAARKGLVVVKIQTQNLTFSYKNTVILDDVNMDVAPAEVMGLIGPNGAGKSTLLRCLVCIHKPRSGKILLDGRPLKGYRGSELARRVAYVPQSANQTIIAKVWEVVLMGRRPHLSFRVSDRDKAVVADVLSMLDLEWAVNCPLDELSGGERQKVFLARALAQETDILLLDEPTSNLDVRYQLDVMDLIRRLSREKGLSVIVAIHDLNLAARYSDRLALLHQRRLVATGPPELVLTRERLADVYGIEARLETNPEGELTVQPIKTLSAGPACANGVRATA
jgi:iron complex transport system ATP-binding protein